jgi:hypothetical protein
VKLFIATPTHSGEVCAAYAVSLVSTTALLSARVQILPHSNFIHNARNILAKEFMASDCTDLLFADADMGWDVEGLLRMLPSDFGVVGAICPRKTEPITWNVNLYRDAGGKPIEHEGLYECGYVGTALMRIKRGVFERLPYPWFNVEYEGERLIGEDAWFCRKWREMGNRIWAAPYIHVTHTGPKQWQGRYDDLRDHANPHSR